LLLQRWHFLLSFLFKGIGTALFVLHSLFYIQFYSFPVSSIFLNSVFEPHIIYSSPAPRKKNIRPSVNLQSSLYSAENFILNFPFRLRSKFRHGNTASNFKTFNTFSTFSPLILSFFFTMSCLLFSRLLFLSLPSPCNSSLTFEPFSFFLFVTFLFLFLPFSHHPFFLPFHANCSQILFSNLPVLVFFRFVHCCSAASFFAYLIKNTLL
jgi:hypothetical protein